jgi:HPt (histidine-containing phosphotransfer) domain-containing protein
MNDCGHPPLAQVRAADRLSGIAFDELLERCLGNLALAERILTSFEQRVEPDLMEIEAALDAGDAARAARLAHQLRGSAANASAGAIESLCGELEKFAEHQDLVAAQRCLVRLDDQWRRLREHRAELPCA